MLLVKLFLKWTVKTTPSYDYNKTHFFLTSPYVWVWMYSSHKYYWLFNCLTYRSTFLCVSLFPLFSRQNSNLTDSHVCMHHAFSRLHSFFIFFVVFFRKIRSDSFVFLLLSIFQPHRDIIAELLMDSVGGGSCTLLVLMGKCVCMFRAIVRSWIETFAIFKGGKIFWFPLIMPFFKKHTHFSTVLPFPQNFNKSKTACRYVC